MIATREPQVQYQNRLARANILLGPTYVTFLASICTNCGKIGKISAKNYCALPKLARSNLAF